MKATLFSGLLALALFGVGCGEKKDANTSTEAASTNITQKSEQVTNVTQPTPAATESVRAPSSATSNDTNEVAVIKTAEGEMVVEFWPDVAPKTVASFKKLAKEKAYDGTVFHRIVKNFMIQGGDLISKDPSKEAQYGSSNPGFTLPAEFSDRKHVKGVISMARLGHDINSASSQFFICLTEVPFLDGQYTAFGKLIKGEDTLMKLGDTPVRMSPSGEASKPTKRVEILSVEIVPRDKVQ